jgi:DNA-binding CsgD family transcriptional regulator
VKRCQPRPVLAVADLFDASSWQCAASQLGLTPNDMALLPQLLRGLSEKETAILLSIKRRTLHARIERLHRRLGVQTRCELILVVVGALVRIATEKQVGGSDLDRASRTWLSSATD